MRLYLKNPTAIAWLLFAAVSVWAECVGDIPELVVGFMIRPRWDLIVPFLNIVTVAGVVQYAVGWRSTRSTRFWRYYAPVMLLQFAIQIGGSMPSAARAMAQMGDSLLGRLGLTVGLGLPLVLFAFTALAVLRLGDYLGSTRRPLGQKPAQLSLQLS